MALETLLTALGIDADEIVDNIKALFEFMKETREIAAANNKMLYRILEMLEEIDNGEIVENEDIPYPTGTGDK